MGVNITGSHLEACLVLGSLAGILGLLGLLRKGQSHACRDSMLVSFTCGLLALGTWFLDGPDWVWQPLSVLGAVVLAMSVLQNRLIQRLGLCLVHLAFHPQVHAGCLVLAGIGLIVWQAHQIDSTYEKDLADSDRLMLELATAPELDILTDVRGITDKGRAVPLCSARSSAALLDGEARLIADQHLDRKVIQTAPADLQYNCHGWVFTGGQHWLRGCDVDQILEDNRYLPIKNPSRGDIAIFRDRQGRISHTALIQTVNHDGTVLLESKWGQAGRFIHTAKSHPYAVHAMTFYHSDRTGHRLQGMIEPYQTVAAE